ncbi:MAG: DinB family protein [Peptococcaceae bacterium]|nr:DinB family protein [Peptococcaceae bacterium]
MGIGILDQLSFARTGTLSTVAELTQTEANIIPQGFNNNILWNLGHLYLSQERFAFHFVQEPMLIPSGFLELFGKGSKPEAWAQAPDLGEIVNLLEAQPNRIREKLQGRLQDAVTNPPPIPGITFSTVEDMLTFNLYHEGIHVQAIRMLRRLIAK